METLRRTRGRFHALTVTPSRSPEAAPQHPYTRRSAPSPPAGCLLCCLRSCHPACWATPGWVIRFASAFTRSSTCWLWLSRQVSLILICAAGRAAVRAFSRPSPPPSLPLTPKPCARISPLSRAGPKTRGVRRAHPEPASYTSRTPCRALSASRSPTYFSECGSPRHSLKMHLSGSLALAGYTCSIDHQTNHSPARALDARNRRSPDLVARPYRHLAWPIGAALAQAPDRFPSSALISFALPYRRLSK